MVKSRYWQAVRGICMVLRDFFVHPVQIGLSVRNFRLNLKNVCTDGICQIFGNFRGDAAGRKVSDKSFTHDNVLPLDDFI